MRVSLNELVQLIAAQVGQPFSVPIQKQLKTIFRYKIADWTQKVIDSHPEQRRYFIKYIIAELERVDRVNCPGIPAGCRVYRTTLQVPTPLRTQYSMFEYVGDSDRVDGYTYTEAHQLPFMLGYGTKYTKDRPRWNYVDSYIYIYNEDMLDEIAIGGIWTDQSVLNPFKCEDVPCYTDDDQLTVPDDIINTIIQDILKNELRLLAPELAEVTVDDTTKQ